MSVLAAEEAEIRAGSEDWPWYWLDAGEKCYFYAVVAAFPADDDAELPKPGTELVPNPEGETDWMGRNGTEMLIGNWILSSEIQIGNAVCSWIAMSHAKHVYDSND